MKKTLLIIITVITVFNALFLNAMAMSDEDWNKYSQELPISTPRYSSNGYEFNPLYWEKDGLIVYGSAGNVKANDRDKYGQFRYLGYDKAGNKFSNKGFKDDYVTNLPLEKQHWLYEPWRWGLCIKNDWSSEIIYADIINKDQEFPILNGLKYDGTEWGSPCSIKTRFGYGLVQSFPSLKKNGSFRMWHKERLEDINPN